MTPPELPQEDTARLAREMLELDKNATEAPWRREIRPGNEAEVVGPGYAFPLAVARSAFPITATPKQNDNVALMAFYRNNAPTLAKAYLELLEKNQRIEGVKEAFWSIQSVLKAWPEGEQEAEKMGAIAVSNHLFVLLKNNYGVDMREESR